MKFMRKNPDASGVHTICLGERETEGRPVLEKIKIQGRDIYDTDNKKEIELLKNDPEVVEVNNKTKIEVNSEE